MTFSLGPIDHFVACKVVRRVVYGWVWLTGRSSASLASILWFGSVVFMGMQLGHNLSRLIVDPVLYFLSFVISVTFSLITVHSGDLLIEARQMKQGDVLMIRPWVLQTIMKRRRWMGVWGITLMLPPVAWRSGGWMLLQSASLYVATVIVDGTGKSAPARARARLAAAARRISLPRVAPSPA